MDYNKTIKNQFFNFMQNEGPMSWTKMHDKYVEISSHGRWKVTAENKRNLRGDGCIAFAKGGYLRYASKNDPRFLTKLANGKWTVITVPGNLVKFFTFGNFNG
mgnify:CR=1 FL=1